MKQDFLLNNLKAKKLYNTYAKDLPIIDFHNHINVSNLKNDHQFSNLTEVWIACDPYKHRLMRICGVDEFYITGDATDFEKFNAFDKNIPKFLNVDEDKINSDEQYKKSRVVCIFSLEKVSNAKLESLQEDE